MGKNIIVSESMVKRLVTEQILAEAGLSTADVTKIVKDSVKDALKNDKEINKDIEKKIKSLVADCVNTLFKTLWQRRNFYEDEIKK